MAPTNSKSFEILGGALSFAGNNDSTQKLIQETWAEILARESGLPRKVFSFLIDQVLGRARNNMPTRKGKIVLKDSIFRFESACLF